MPEQVAEQPDGPVPPEDDLAEDEVTDPSRVSVRIEAQEEVFIGQSVKLTLHETGKITRRRWKVIPANAGELIIFDHGRQARFLTEFDQPYVFAVSVAGKDVSGRDDLVMDLWTVTVVARGGGESQQRGSTAMAIEPRGDDPLAKVLEWAAEVQSPTRRVELARMADGLELAAGSIKGGLMHGDYWQKARARCRLALGTQASLYDGFFAHMDELIQVMVDEKIVSDPKNPRASAGNWSKLFLKFADGLRTVP